MLINLLGMLNKIAVKILPKSLYGRLWRRKNWRIYSNRFKDAIHHFVIEKGIEDPIVVNHFHKKLVKAFIKDNWYPDEYFFFNYDRLSRKGIKEFVPNREANLFWNHQNTKEIYQLTCDKGLTYCYFKKYFQREAVAVSQLNPDSIKDFESFIERHPKFIIKPLFGNYGNGVQILDVYGKDNRKTISDLLASYSLGFIAEELIVQCEDLASFHPSSVNTVRITTVRESNGDVYIIHRPFIRFGTGGRCVDNGGNYGIFGGIDYETGIIVGAVDERMNRFVIHPNSGKVIIGYRVPRWDEAKRFVVELANVLPELRYCGWDLALTNDGWVMVEANGKGLFIGFQMPTQTGFRDEFEDIKKRCDYCE